LRQRDFHRTKIYKENIEAWYLGIKGWRGKALSLYKKWQSNLCVMAIYKKSQKLKLSDISIAEKGAKRYDKKNINLMNY